MILVSGFKPFHGEKINPTEKMIDELRRLQKETGEYADISSLVLPVSYQEAPVLLQKTIDEINPKKVLMMGQAGGSAKIRLERIALNWQEAARADENGYLPKPAKIAEGKEAAYFSELDLGRIKGLLELKNIPVEISLSAGSFVCNRVYYEYFKNNQSQRPGLFVHFPFLAEQVMGNKNSAFLDWETQIAAFRELLKFFRE